MEANGKSSWPELVGKNVDEAIEIIKQENPALTVVKLEDDSMYTCDYLEERVRVFYNTESNLVTRKPKRG